MKTKEIISSMVASAADEASISKVCDKLKSSYVFWIENGKIRLKGIL